MTLRTWWRLAAIGLVAVVVQVAVLNQIEVGGAHPDLFLCVAIGAGLVAGAQQGAVVGFAAGLVADLFTVTPYGLSALTFVLVAFFVGLLAALPAGRGSLAFRVVATFGASIAGTLVYAGLLILLGQPHLPRSELAGVVAVVSVANAVLALPVTGAMGWAFAGGTGARELAPAGGWTR